MISDNVSAELSLRLREYRWGAQIVKAAFTSTTYIMVFRFAVELLSIFDGVKPILIAQH